MYPFRHLIRTAPLLFTLMLWLAPSPAPAALPTIQGTPATAVAAGGSYQFEPWASDPDGQPLRFTVWNKPDWASFDPATGRLGGNPTAANVGTTYGIVVAVNDGNASSSLEPFDLTVLGSGTTSQSNGLPSIQGSPATVVAAGGSYQFVPSASHPDGSPLRFTVWNKPDWASFDPATGRLGGNPTAANVGTTYGIVVAVNDGNASSSLSPFNLTVEAGHSAAAGVAVISWSAPTQNTDGSWLTNLAGFRLYYGMSPSALTRAFEFGSPDTTIVRYEELRSGTHYFAISAYNQDGVEGPLSEIGSKTIP